MSHRVDRRKGGENCAGLREAMAGGNITLPDELLPQLQELARSEDRSVDEVADEAVKQHLIRRFWEHKN
jgi:predicted transcriptional regulator